MHKSDVRFVVGNCGAACLAQCTHCIFIYFLDKPIGFYNERYKSTACFAVFLW